MQCPRHSIVEGITVLSLSSDSCVTISICNFAWQSAEEREINYLTSIRQGEAGLSLSRINDIQ